MRSFETGEYRNIFKETGKSDEEITKKIKDAVFTFFYDETREFIILWEMIWVILWIRAIMM